MKSEFNLVTVFILVLILLVPSPVRASSDTASLMHTIQQGYVPFYTGTISISADLNISVLGNASCYSSISLYPGYSANLSMYLQRKTSNTTWTNIESWYGSGSGIPGVTLSKSYSGLTSGSVYRVFVQAYVSQNGYFVERISISSAEKVY